MATPLFTRSVLPRTNLAAQLCARLPDPPQTDAARREVMEQVELQVEDRALAVSTCDVGPNTLEVYCKWPIPARTPVRARLWGGQSEWSDAVVTRCLQTVGGWKVEMRFAGLGIGGRC